MAITFVPYSSTPTVTTATAIGGYVTATGVTSVVIGLNAANTSTTSAQYFDLIRSNGVTAYYIVRAVPVPPQSSFVAVGGVAPKVIMASGYSMQAICYATTGLLDFTMSVMEKA